MFRLAVYIYCSVYVYVQVFSVLSQLVVTQVDANAAAAEPLRQSLAKQLEALLDKVIPCYPSEVVLSASTDCLRVRIISANAAVLP